MQKDGKVSLWLGNFNSEEAFYEFVNIQYSEDGDAIPSIFEQLFKIEDYDEDFSEMEYMEESSEDLEIILDGASNDYEIIPKFREIYNGGIYNTIVLLYDFEYNQKVEGYKNEKDTLVFIGCVDYTK